jgi:hypothetical protein
MQFKMVCLSVLAAAMLAGCAPSAPPVATADAAAEALTCTQSHSATMPLTGPEAQDTVTVHSLASPALSTAAQAGDTSMNGELCNNATLVLTVHGQAFGGLLYTYARPLQGMDVHTLARTPAQLGEFLQTWLSSIEVVSTERAPELTADGSVSSPFPAAEYAGLKALKLPLMCFASSVHDQSCVLFNPDISDRGELFSEQTES